MFMSLMTGKPKYTSIPVTPLIIFANPHSLGAWVDNNPDPALQKAAEAYSTALTALTQRQEKAVQDGVPTAHIITLPRANHYVFLSNETDVLRSMQTFIYGLH
jgi:hypothetical protein